MSEVLSSDKLIKEEDISEGPTLSSYKVAVGGGYYTVTLKDGSKWYQGNKGIERIIAADYLDKELKELNNGWEAVETKFRLKNEANKFITVRIKKTDTPGFLEGIPTIISDDIITFSKDAGHDEPDTSSLSAEGRSNALQASKIEKCIGYNDFVNSVNLRLQDDGKIVMIDTEYGSFTNDNGSLLSDESEALLGGSEFDFPVVDILGEDVFNNHDGIENLI